MKKFLAVFVTLFLFSCATGPVHMAMNESESIRTSYDDVQLKTMYDKNRALLHDIYVRLNSSKINLYKEGLGFTTLRDQNKMGHYYLMVNIRPPDITFDGNSTKPLERFGKVISGQFNKYLAYVKKSDFETSGAEGLSLGVYWPVRDFSQCRENGGFIEYIIVYLSRDDLYSILEGNKTFAEVAQDSEIMASLNLEAPKYYKPVYQ